MGFITKHCDMSVQTVFIVVSRSAIVRNVLRTEAFRAVLQRPAVRVVLFVPRGTPDEFRKEFASDRVLIEEFAQAPYSRFRKRVFLPALRNLLWTSATKLVVRYGSRRDYEANPVLLGLAHFYFGFVSRVSAMRRLMLFLERILYPDRAADRFFVSYQPDLVVSTYQRSTADVMFLKAARRFRVRSVGFLKGWDNLDSYLFQIYPDDLVVQAEFLKERANAWHGVPAARISVVGFPQFDAFTDKNILKDRDAFLGSVGLDPGKRVIFYGSEGPWSPQDREIALKLVRWISDPAALPKPCSLILRPYFSTFGDKPYEEFRGRANVYIDDSRKRTKGFLDVWDADDGEVRHLANVLGHSDVTLNVRSTLSMDAAMFDKPVVNVGYGVYHHGPVDTTWRLYKVPWYQDILATGGIRLAKNDKELLEAIRLYLVNPSADAEGRKRIRETFCLGDGASGRRLGDALLRCLGA